MCHKNVISRVEGWKGSLEFKTYVTQCSYLIIFNRYANLMENVLYPCEEDNYMEESKKKDIKALI